MQGPQHPLCPQTGEDVARISPAVLYQEDDVRLVLAIQVGRGQLAGIVLKEHSPSRGRFAETIHLAELRLAGQAHALADLKHVKYDLQYGP
jgi:hypothetical protein